MQIKEGEEVLIKKADICGRVTHVQTEAGGAIAYGVLIPEQTRWYRASELEAVEDLAARERQKLQQRAQESLRLNKLSRQWRADQGNQLLIAQIAESLKKFGCIDPDKQ